MSLNAGVSIAESYDALLPECLDKLLGQVHGHKVPVVCFRRLRVLLEGLPHGSEEFALAVNRLANARQYQVAGEHGAARYELRLLRRSLEQ